MLKNLIYIFLGGGVGSVFRYLISSYTQKLWTINLFPVGTFLVNVTGCFLIGLFSANFLKVDNALKYLLITGVCGGYTTFSTFSAENLSLWQSGNYFLLLIYTFLSLVLGLIAVFLGYQIAKM